MIGENSHPPTCRPASVRAFTPYCRVEVQPLERIVAHSALPMLANKKKSGVISPPRRVPYCAKEMIFLTGAALPVVLPTHIRHPWAVVLLFLFSITRVVELFIRTRTRNKLNDTRIDRVEKRTRREKRKKNRIKNGGLCGGRGVVRMLY